MTERSTITAGAVWARLDAPSDVLAAARAALAVLDPDAAHKRAFQSGRWDGQVQFMRRPGNDFLAGLTWRVAAAVTMAGYERPKIGWPSVREHPPLSGPLRGIEWRPYQVAAVDKALRARRMAMQCPTRSGKTEMGIEFVRRVGGRALWVTHTRELLRQTPERFRDRLGVECGVVGGATRTDGPVVVGMVQTLIKLVNKEPQFFEQFDVLVMDEAHHAGADTWQDVARACARASHRLGLSGTMSTGNRVTDLRIEGALGPTHVVSTTVELADMGFVARPRVVLVSVSPPSYPAYEEVREAVCPNWRDDPQGLLSRLGGALFRESYRRGITENEERNWRIIHIATGHADAGDKFLVLCNRVPHAQRLHADIERRTSSPVWVLDGGALDDERRRTLAKFKAVGGGAVLVCTPFFREGVDLPQIDAGMLAGGGESSIAVLQGLGRMLTVRPDKPEVLIYDFTDGRDETHEKDYLAQHRLSRVSLYKKNGFVIERG
jgi:superfamily II DNA or RNA helicase